MYGQGSARFVPVQVGDELEVEIEAVGAKGDGIAKKDGFVLFVPGVNKGDKVKIRVTKVLRKVGFAEVAGAGAPKAEKSESEASEEPAAEEEPSAEELPGEEASEDSEDFGDEN